ncbi:unnamed protein product [Thlaspi arvense]|uniref:Alpha-1,2-Mannosidase n=1 Tax=Thlaspi arvense TaxID=13288 RepID=A0AAU9S0K6_THLAR|nr:unnamed protein product [Thlaspi arvense]
MSYSLRETSLQRLRRNPLSFMKWIDKVKDVFHWECSLEGPEGSPYEGGRWNTAMTVADIIETVWNLMVEPSLENPMYVVEAIRDEYLQNNEVFVWIARSMTENQGLQD